MQDLKTVKFILEKYYSLKENPTYLFGSRTSNKFRKDSDLDILIEDKNIKPEIISYLDEAFEESDILYKVDIVLRSRISEDFYKKIKDQLKEIEVFDHK